MKRLVLFPLLLFLIGCDPGTAPVVLDWSLLDDGPPPLNRLKYRYAGTAIEEDDKRVLYYCANIDRADRFFITDHIVMRTAVREPEWKAIHPPGAGAPRPRRGGKDHPTVLRTGQGRDNALRVGSTLASGAPRWA